MRALVSDKFLCPSGYISSSLNTMKIGLLTPTMKTYYANYALDMVYTINSFCWSHETNFNCVRTTENIAAWTQNFVTY